MNDKKRNENMADYTNAASKHRILRMFVNLVGGGVPYTLVLAVRHPLLVVGEGLDTESVLEQMTGAFFVWSTPDGTEGIVVLSRGRFVAFEPVPEEYKPYFYQEIGSPVAPDYGDKDDAAYAAAEAFKKSLLVKHGVIDG